MITPSPTANAQDVTATSCATQHTPGPWRVSVGDETQVFAAANQNITSANCGGLSGIRVAEAEANARLIAAAPELLAALLVLIPRNVALGNPNWADGTIIPVDMALGELRQARAAIEKATAA